MQMPGPVSRVLYDDATEMVHVLGRTPDGSASTIYVIETHAKAVFADAPLPFDPSAWVMDAARDFPTDDRQAILTFSPTGEVASVDVGMHEFAWRLPGVLAGAAMAGFLYLLARILFRRRSVGVLVGVIAVCDGMLFVQSRIGMNDAYVGLAIVAAYTIFAALWMGTGRFRGAFWILMPVIGAILGLGLASKWVALYALGGIALLIMVRSALGRLLAILALIAMTAGLGYLAINVPAGTGFGNLPFVAIMVGLTVIAVVANVPHPIAWSLDEIRFAVGAPIVARRARRPRRVGRASRAAGRPRAARPQRRWSTIAAALALFGGPLAWAAFAVAARLGFGPLAPAPAPDDPAALLAAAGAATGRGLAAARRPARPARRLDGRLPPGPAGRDLHRVVHPVGAHRQPRPVRRAGRRATPARRCVDLTGADVQLPQRPDGAARRVVAVVGVAVRPQAGLVLPGGLRRQHDRRDLRRRQPRHLVARPAGARLRGVAGVRAAEPAARADHDRLRRASGCPGPGSIGPRSSTTTTRACRS